MKNDRKLYVLYLVPFILLFPVTLIAQGGDQVEGLWDNAFGDPAQGGHGLSSSVTAIAVHPLTGDVYAAGNFRDAGSERVNNIARWDGIKWHPLGGGVNNIVHAMVISPDGTVYAGGRITEAVQPGGAVVPVAYVAKWDGVQWSPAGRGVDGRVTAMGVDKMTGHIYVGGDANGGFDHAINTDGSMVYSPKIVRWDGVEWHPLGRGLLAGFGHGVGSIAVHPASGNVVIAGTGNFSRVYNADSTQINISGLAEWDGSEWSNIGSRRPSVVAFDSGGLLYAGGNMTVMDGLTVNRIAVWDGNEWSALGNGIQNGIVTSILTAGNSVYVGGSFTLAENGDGTVVGTSLIARWDTGPKQWSSLGSGAYHRAVAYVDAIAADAENLNIFAAGRFTDAGAMPARYFSRWIADPPDYDAAYVTFQLDQRRLMRAGLYNPNYRMLVNIAGGELAGSYFLYDTDNDSIATVRVPQPVGINAEYVFSLDLNGDGYQVNDDWISELDAPNGVVRQLLVPTSNPVELSVVSYDNLPLSTFDSGFEAQWLRSFQSGTSGFITMGNTKVRMQFQNLDRGTLVNTRRFMKDPGGTLPEGIAIMASNIMWEIHRAPQAADFSSTVVMFYDLIAGDVHQPEDLRLLYMPEESAEWEVLATVVDQNAQSITAAGRTSIVGRYTLGSISLNNLGELLPDLVVSDLTVPHTAFSGREIELEWTVTNSGARPTNVPVWHDRVYLSGNATFNRSEAILLGKFENVAFLSEGSSYTSSVKVHLPDGLNGTWHLFVETDGDNTQQEINEENNVTGPGPVDITLSPFADLQVVSLVTSPNVFSGDSITVQWTVENMGSGLAEAPEWYDHIYLGAGSDLDFNFTSIDELIIINDTEIGWLKRQGVLQPGESYTVTSRVKLPDEAIGDFYLFVYTDLDRSGGKRFFRGRVFEFNQEFNNWLGQAINIVLTPPPDLVPGITQVPATARSGERITVGWEVENQGPGATRSAGWTDAVFLSASPEPDISKAYTLGAQTYTAEAQFIPDSKYSRTMDVTLPDGIEGTWYLHVYTDRFSNVYEYNFKENNIAQSEPVTIQRSLYPDLTASGVVVPPAVAAGERIGVTWQITNNGEKATEGSRTDFIYVSSSSEWNAEEAILLDKVNQARPAGISETQSFTHLVRLPHDLLGTNYLYVLVNADSTQFEYPDASDNLGRSQPVEVSAYPPPDLMIEQLTIPANAASGQPATFGWTIKNAGSGATLAPQWDEVIYLSTVNDIPFDPDQAIPVSRTVRKGELPAGDSYERSFQATIPDGVSGDYYVIVATENDSLNGDADTSNNVMVSETQLTVALSPPADLEVVQFDVPAAVNAGEVSLIRWTVENTGSGASPAGRWFDALYLTVQTQIDKNAILLGTVEHEGSLEPGSMYEQELEVEFPAYISGAYNLIVRTDSRNDIYEHEGEDNNLGTHPVSVTVPSPTDLVITHVEVDDNAVPGELTTVSWTLVNQGTNPAKARIREAVYILPDSVYDPAAPVLGIIDRDIDLDPGADIVISADLNVRDSFQIDDQGNIIAPLPPVVEGDYRIAVRTNLRKTVRETNLQNNTGISAGSVSVTVPELISGEPISVFIGETEKNLYRFEIPDGADVIFRLGSGSEIQGSAALYLSRGKAPTRSDFDYSAAEPFMLNQEIRLPGAEGGTWYLMVYVESAGEPTQFDVSARILDYVIEKLTPDYGGNTGVVTIYVTGAKFQNGSTLYLEDAGGRRLAAQGTYVINSTELAARLLLDGEAVGTRNVVIVAPGGEETIFPNGFDVVDGVGASPYTRLSYPAAVAGRQGFTVEVTVGNDGTNNATDYFLLLGARAWRQPIIIVVSGKIAASEQIEQSIRLEMKDNFPKMFEVPDVDDIPMYVRFEEGNNHASVVMPLWIYEIPPGAEFTFQIEIAHDLLAGTISHGAHLVPMPESEFTRTGSPDDLDSSVGFQIMAESMRLAIADLASTAGSEIMNDSESGLRDLLGAFGRYGLPAYGFGGGIVGGFIGYAAVAVFMSSPPTALLGTGLVLGALVGGVIGAIIDYRNARDEITESGSNLIKSNLNFEGTKKTEVKASKDPNDIIGPEGHGEEKWVGIQNPLQYTIRFENDPELATAPAQIVSVRQDLDPHADIRSFRLGQFGFGPFTFNPPVNSSYHSERLNVADSLGVMVDITAGIDVITRQAFWVFRSIDPSTGDLPHSVLSGFLPPNDTTGAGEGFVNYRIRPDQSSQTGDELHAEARIIFDLNLPIDTPPVFNTIDANLPVSTLQASHTQMENSISYELEWMVEDIGSGLRDVAIFISENDSPFALLKAGIQEVSYVFNGEPGVSYRFFSIATDNAGNVEPMKTSEDAISSSEGNKGEQEIPDTFTLYQNYPNPFNPSTTVLFDLPQSANVDLLVYNTLGQRVMLIRKGELAPGRYNELLHFNRFASGIYFYEIRAMESGRLIFNSVRKLIYVK